MPDAPVEWTSLGQVPYAGTIVAMEARARAIRDGAAPEAVWLLEHPPTYTGGTSARPADLLDHSIPAIATGRGGQWTFHGPGQRIAYVMLDLTRPRISLRTRDVKSYVWHLEEWLIRTVAAFGIEAVRRDTRVGLWVPGEPDRKIAAIGVRLTRWVSWHGVALNIAPDLARFAGIVPCGVADAGVTSLAALGVRPSMAEVDAALRQAWSETFSPSPATGSTPG